MAEYINKETARSVIMGQPTDAHYPDWYAAQIKEIEPADVAPVVHARWVQCFEDWRKQIEGDKCSACGFEHYGCAINHYRYCPNCGAKMDGERRNDG